MVNGGHSHRPIHSFLYCRVYIFGCFSKLIEANKPFFFPFFYPRPLDCGSHPEVLFSGVRLYWLVAGF